jgi:hypothetical protein
MGHFGGRVTIAMYQGQAHHGDVENSNCSDVGDTGAKDLVPFFGGGNIEDRAKDQDVR